jgi:hypothetical protein
MELSDNKALARVAHVERKRLPYAVKPKSTLWVLYPFLMWKVLIPKATKRKLDMFEEYILRLCAAGIRSAKDIGQCLELHPDLIAYIILRLQEKDFLDDNDETTVQGKRLLTEQSVEDQELEPCYVFAEPSSHHLWPYIHRGLLPVVEAEPRGKRWTIQHGSQGEPKRSSAWQLDIIYAEQKFTPSPASVLEAGRKHRARIKMINRQVRSADQAEEDTDEAAVATPKIADRVFITSEEPDIVYWSAFIHIPEGVDGQRGWQVCDPFGLGSSVELRRHVAKRIEKDGDFRKYVQAKYDLALSLNEADVGAFAEELNAEAGRIVLSQTGPNIRKHGDLFSLLIQMQSIICEKGDRQSVVRRAHECLEEMMAVHIALDQTFTSDSRVDEMLANDPEDNAGTLLEIAEHLGFQHEEALYDFFKVSRGQVTSCLRYEGRKLSAQTALAVMLAQNNTLPSFRDAAARCPDLLSRLYLINLWRDRAAHAAEATTDGPPSSDELSAHVYAALGALCPDLAGNQCETASSVGSTVWSSAQLAASVPIDLELGQPLRRHADLFDHVLAMQSHRRLVLSSTTNADAVRTSHAKDAIYEAGCCLEVIYRMITDRFPPRLDDIPIHDENREGVVKYFNEAARALGWLRDADAMLPDHIVNIAPRKLKIAASTRSGSLNSLFLLCLAAAMSNQSHPFRVVAVDWLGCTTGASLVRGHGDAARDGAVVDDTCKQVMTIVAAVVKYLSA